MRSFIRLTLLSVLLTVFSISAAIAQRGSIRFSGSPLTVRRALEEVREQTGYGIAFNSRIFDATRQVELNSPAPTLDDAIGQIVAGTGFVYTIDRGIILLTKGDAEESRPQVVLEHHPETNDIYLRNLASDFGTDSHRRPLTEQPEMVASQVVEEPHYELSSHHESLESFAATQGALPRWAIKTNLLYAAATLTPNLTVEAGLGRRTSLQLSGSYNPWHLKGTIDNDKKSVHMILKPEFRWWPCERFNGHFFGADLIFARYNISTHDVPLLFEKEYRYDGIAYGAGVTYGYNLMLAKRWSLEFAVGVGVLGLDYDRYTCAACDRNAIPVKKIYFGPTNAAINLSFLIK
jgi:hypothetical protein